jgi:hypothetical protein
MNRTVLAVIIVIIAAIVAFYIGCKTSEKPMQTSFPGAEKHEISLAEAKTFIENHQKSLLAQNSKEPQIKAETFERSAIEKILAQPGCNGLRIYYGKDENGKPNLVLVGADTSGKDMMIIMEKGTLCPPFCN